MVKSIHIGHGCVLFIGEEVEVWFKISLLHLVPGCLAAFAQWGVTATESQGSTPKVDQNCRKSHSRLCGWIFEDIVTPLTLPHLCSPIISHQQESRHWLVTIQFLLSCTHISLRTHVVFYYHKQSRCTAYDTAVCKSLLRWLRALTLPDGFWQMLVFMCSATAPLRHDILPFLLSSMVSPLQSWTFSTGDNLLLNILS